ncbi:MAG: permease [Herpetosiphon sp.]
MAFLSLSSMRQPFRGLLRMFPIVTYLPLVLLLWLGSGIGVPADLEAMTPRVQGLVTIFLSLFIEVLPFLVGGVLLSAVIALYVDDRSLHRFIPHRPWVAALVGSGVGLIFPVCECGTVPAARRLLHKGAPLPFAVAFLLGAPVINPIVIASTYVAFNGDWIMVGSRVGLTLLVSVTVALAMSWLPRQGTLLARGVRHLESGCQCASHSGERSVGGVLRHSATELVEMSRWLILGALFAATVQTFVPQSLLLQLGGGRIVSVVLLMALAVLLSVCSTVDAFLALALSGTFAPGALLAFLVFGPMVDIKSTFLFLTTLSPRAVMWMVGIIVPLVLAAGIVVNYTAR